MQHEIQYLISYLDRGILDNVNFIDFYIPLGISFFVYEMCYDQKVRKLVCCCGNKVLTHE